MAPFATRVTSENPNPLLVIEDSWGYVFGGLLAPGGPLHPRPSYYGTGETFVFRARRQRARELARVRRELTEVVARVLERVGDLVRLYGARAVGVEQLEEERAQVRQ